MGMLNCPPDMYNIFWCVVDDLVGLDETEGPTHELDNWEKAVHGRAHTKAGKACLTDRGVDDASGTKLIHHPLAYFVIADLFAHEKDAVIARHFFCHGFTQRFAKSNQSPDRVMRFVRPSCTRLCPNTLVVQAGRLHHNGNILSFQTDPCDRQPD